MGITEIRREPFSADELSFAGSVKPEYFERNKEIYLRVVQGETIANVAAAYEISPSRIEQIVLKMHDTNMILRLKGK